MGVLADVGFRIDDSHRRKPLALLVQRLLQRSRAGLEHPPVNNDAHGRSGVLRIVSNLRQEALISRWRAKLRMSGSRKSVLGRGQIRLGAAFFRVV